MRDKQIAIFFFRAFPLWAGLCALVLFSPPQGGRASAETLIPIDPAAAVVHGSGPANTFARAANLKTVSIVPGQMRLVVEHANPWPAVSIDGGPPSQAATLWVFLYLPDGKWHAAGAERLRPTQIDGDPKPEDSDLSKWIGESWLYDAGRWGPMAGYRPRPGELVGLMVAAGSSRSDDQAPVRERTNVVQIAWPGPTGAPDAAFVWSEGGPVPDPGPGPSPTPDLAAITARLGIAEKRLDDALRKAEALEGRIKGLEDQSGGVAGRLGALEGRMIWSTCVAKARLGFADVPISCKLQ